MESMKAPEKTREEEAAEHQQTLEAFRLAVEALRSLTQEQRKRVIRATMVLLGVGL